MDPLLSTAVLALLALAFASALLRWRKQAADVDGARTFPPAPPGSWPLLGHMPLLATGCPHHTLAQLSRAGLGPIIGLRLGSKRAAVICNSHLAREVLFTHDKILANRPRFAFADHAFYGYNSSIAFTTYNPRWAMLRKLCTLELSTPRRIQALGPLRYKEVHNLLRALQKESHDGKHPVDLGKIFCLMLSNTIGYVLHSKPLAEAGGQDYSSLLKDQEHIVAPTVGDFIPWLKFLNVFPKRAMQDVHGRNDRIIESMISQRRQLLQGREADELLPQDLLQVLLSREAESQQASGLDADERLNMKEIKGTIMDVMSAGTHTTALTLEWCMAELLRNPLCMQTLRAEIDDAIGTGSDRFVTDEDVAKLPYLQSVVREVFRLHPAVPLLIPRAASEGVKVDKYVLPAGTIVLVNAWAIGRDPDVWESPEEFRPARFGGRIKDPVDVKGQHYDLLPFGSGRRICPGLRLALSILHVTLANLVSRFEWDLPNGQTAEELDMSEKRGITSMRSTPLQAIPKIRFSY